MTFVDPTLVVVLCLLAGLLTGLGFWTGRRAVAKEQQRRLEELRHGP